MYSLVITPNANQQRFQPQDFVIDSHSKKRNTLTKMKLPREVSLRVKFIRLGEVSSIVKINLL